MRLPPALPSQAQPSVLSLIQEQALSATSLAASPASPPPASSTSSPAGPAADANPGPPPLTPADPLLAMASGAWVTPMIQVAAELGVADQLAAGERGAEELAAACGIDADSLFRLLRGLASLGIIQETAPPGFALTPLAQLLRSDHPQSLRMFAPMLDAMHDLSWADLLHTDFAPPAPRNGPHRSDPRKAAGCSRCAPPPPGSPRPNTQATASGSREKPSRSRKKPSRSRKRQIRSGAKPSS